MALRHVVEVGQFDRDALLRLFDLADEMRRLERPSTRQAGRILATLFYEPSTRTRLSFESAMHRLGGAVISTENAREFSSAIKGETVEDTVRMASGYADVIVLRHHERGAVARAAAVSTVPIINGGDGPGEHPTQALLDLYTIRHELGRIDDLTLLLMGDLKHGRTARSLALLMRRASRPKLIFVNPPETPMGEDVRAALADAGVVFREEPRLDRALSEADVVYQTRVQKERFVSVDDYEAAKGSYVLGRTAYDLLKSTAVVLHPLPRVDEISTEVDGDPRSAYFRQAYNGVFIRMALLDMLLTARG